MARNFVLQTGIDWITMYQQYAANGFCPPNFDTWCAVAAISAACERRIWIDHGRRKTFANVFILLLSYPGAGKSSAIDPLRGTILNKLRSGGLDPRTLKPAGINFCSNQSSEAGFYDPQFRRTKKFFIGNQEHTQSPGMMIFTEACNAIKDLNGGGTIAKALTEFYDCPSHWSKQLTKSDPIELVNICPSMLAACTFSDLSDIIPQKNIEGGLASRFIYVPDFEKRIRTPPFRDPEVNANMADRLAEDLQEIYSMSGEMKVDESFWDEWSYLHGESDKAKFNSASSPLQCLIARRFSNIEKLSIIVSLAESTNMKITRDHWKRAEGLIDAQAQFLPSILEYASIADNQNTMIETIKRFVEEGDHDICDVKNHLYEKGVAPLSVDMNVDFMIRNKVLIIASSGIISNRISVNNEANLTVVRDVSDVDVEPLPAEITH